MTTWWDKEIPYKTDLQGAHERIRAYVQKRFGQEVPDVLRQFLEYYEAIEPDLVVTASHATEINLEMPGSVGNIRCRDGRLYVEDLYGIGTAAWYIFP